VLIGHSFGGLVLKSLVVKLKTMESGTDDWSKAAVQRGKAFLSNVRGVAFYAVPHSGSTTFAKYVMKLLSCNERDLAQIMVNIRPSQRDMEDLSGHFDDIVKANKIIIYAFCEARPMEKVVSTCWRKWIFGTKHL
jgi:triacylglycerol esterase/lipase EstA (alpha/beta hydrolase family)